jgi:hypothetical protein
VVHGVMVHVAVTQERRRGSAICCQVENLQRQACRCGYLVTSANTSKGLIPA